MPTFVVEARHTPETLARIVLLFHRRRVPIHSLSARVGQDSTVLRVEVDVREDEDRTRLIEANLYKLVEVLSVQQKTKRLVPRRQKKGSDLVHYDSGE